MQKIVNGMNEKLRSLPDLFGKRKGRSVASSS